MQDLLITDSRRGGLPSPASLASWVARTPRSRLARRTSFEAAHFDSVSIARSARRHKLHSESSASFEQGRRPALPAVAAQRAVELLVEYGGGTVDEGVTDVDQRPARQQSSRCLWAGRGLSPGVAHSPERIAEPLTTVGCTVEGPSDGVFTVTVLVALPDLTLAADLAEEIAHLDGYDKIPVISPMALAASGLTPAQKARRLRRGAGPRRPRRGRVPPRVRHDRQGILRATRVATLCARTTRHDDAPWPRTSVLDTLAPAVAGHNRSGVPTRTSPSSRSPRLPSHRDGARRLARAETRPSDEVLAALEAGIPAQPGTHRRRAYRRS